MANQLLLDNVDFYAKNQATEILNAISPESEQITDTSLVNLKPYTVGELQGFSADKFSENIKTTLSSALSTTSNDTKYLIQPLFNIIHGTPFPDLIIGTKYNDIIFGKDGNDILTGGTGFYDKQFDGNDIVFGDNGNDLFIGGTGNDIFVGGNGLDTADYSFLNTTITLKAAGVIEKKGVGTDTIFQTEIIKGAFGLANTIDGSVPGGNPPGLFLNVNLQFNSLTVNNIPGVGNQSFTVQNFVNVIGTSNNDTIVGNTSNNVLTGGAGNDFISGLDGNDILTGVSPSSSTPGLNEIDTLIGGNGADKFILGDVSNVYYRGFAPLGSSDYAQIQDFQSGLDKIQLKGSSSNYILNNPSFIFLDKGFLGVLDSSDDLIATVGGTGFTNTDLVFV